MSNHFDPQAYGSVCAELLESATLCELGPGTPNREFEATLKSLDEATIFGGQSVADHDLAACCISGFWLLYNFLDASHSISQSIHSRTGSYWHGIMHRREPDYSNAKYWCRRYDGHALFPELGEAAADLARSAGTDGATDFLVAQSTWNPIAFVDLCEAASRGQADEALCRRIAQLEWQMLFDYCYRGALDRR